MDDFRSILCSAPFPSLGSHSPSWPRQPCAPSSGRHVLTGTIPLGLLTQVWHVIQASPVKALQVFQLEMKESQSFLEVVGYKLDIGEKNGKELLCTVHILFVLFQTTLLLHVNTF